MPKAQVGAAANSESRTLLKTVGFVGGRDADRNWRPGVPATCPNGGATADSHGLSRATCPQTRR